MSFDQQDSNRLLLIVGLGNPGPRYRNTRHNIGFMVVERLAEKLGATFDREKFGGLIAQGRHGGKRLLLLKPLTFMNKSGTAVAQAMRNQIREPGDLLVVFDDVDLPLGRLRLRKKGSAGGHNGLKSIIAHIGAKEFPRLRIGIGRSTGERELTNHVLGKFTPEERDTVGEAVEKAVQAVLVYAEHGVDAAMNQFNAGPAGSERENP